MHYLGNNLDPILRKFARLLLLNMKCIIRICFHICTVCTSQWSSSNWLQEHILWNSRRMGKYCSSSLFDSSEGSYSISVSLFKLIFHRMFSTRNTAQEIPIQRFTKCKKPFSDMVNVRNPYESLCHHALSLMECVYQLGYISTHYINIMDR